ncbi:MULTISPECIES: hypothetical protein [Sphingomonadales]|uniref:hypothetical protein n=1 Tax=Sphingomonadales TaxID=204457 RepID=UPI000B3361D2|nr:MULTISPECIES: hypothetical protein [Sphingomonadales]
MSGIPEFASLEQMQAWAHELMASRAPDFVIGDDYLRRWYVIPRNPSANVYLHHILHSDDDRALHDHPWSNTSVLIGGRYVEHMAAPGGGEIRVTRHAGDVVTRMASDAHRLEIMPGESAISLFITGPKVRDWGFHCPKGWVPWQEFTSPEDSSKTGKGCGE